MLSTHDKMLDAQISQQANSSSTPPYRLPSKPGPNSREQCNTIIMRSGTQLENPKGTRVEVEGKNDHDEPVTTFPSKDKV